VEGWPAIRASLAVAGPEVWAAVLWQSWGNTLIGYTAWAWLLARHPAATISPLALLVPVVGMSSSAWWLGEPLPAWKLAAAGLVIAGLGLNLLAARRRA
jgi:O-acetylserine/cysteine efflux transporter